MNKIFILLVIMFLLFQGQFIQSPTAELEIPIGSDISSPTVQTFGDGCRYPIQGWVYVQIKGDPFERGHQYGYLLHEEIIDLMNRWSNMIHNHPQLTPFSKILSQHQYDAISAKWWNFCMDLTETMYWDEYPEEYKLEIQGIAEGLRERGGTIHGHTISYKDVLASNSMYEMLSKLSERKIRKGFHPLFTFYNMIHPDISAYSSVSAETFINDFIGDSDKPFHHKCSSFIATGDATTDGQIILSNSMWSTSNGSTWWWANYIAIRWNILLDVIPTTGHRFQMSCAPGYIWSDHDFYQNNVGLCFIETTVHQGIWKEKGLPLAIRARKAVQYAESIDDVIYYLKTDNDGVMNAVWLIGDTNTGEIVRYELGLYQDALINRTKNGFLWSSNNPMDFGVRLEKMDWKECVKQLMKHVLFGTEYYQYYTPWYLPAKRDIAFKELGEKYYGSIDAEIVKHEIMGVDPIGSYSPDCKITSSDLVKNNGIWLFTGSPQKKPLDMANFNYPEVPHETILPVGWVRLYGKPEQSSSNPSAVSLEPAGNPRVLWSVDTKTDENDFYSRSIIVDDTFYTTSSTGELYAINKDSGDVLWVKDIGRNPTRPSYSDNVLFIGTREGLKKVDLGWFTIGEKQIDPIHSDPVCVNESVFAGTETGFLSAYHIITGHLVWDHQFDAEVYISDTHEAGFIVVSSGKNLYGIQHETGIISWQQEINGIITAKPVIDSDMVFIGSWDTSMYAFNLSDGEIIWSFETGWGIETTATTYKDNIIFGSHDGIIYSVNRNSGDLVWKKACNAGIHGSPVSNDAFVVFGCDNGYLYCLDGDTGDTVWMFAPGRTIKEAQNNYLTTAIVSDITIKDNIVFFGACGTFYALNLL